MISDSVLDSLRKTGCAQQFTSLEQDDLAPHPAILMYILDSARQGASVDRELSADEARAVAHQIERDMNPSIGDDLAHNARCAHARQIECLRDRDLCDAQCAMCAAFLRDIKRDSTSRNGHGLERAAFPPLCVSGSKSARKALRAVYQSIGAAQDFDSHAIRGSSRKRTHHKSREEKKTILTIAHRIHEREKRSIMRTDEALQRALKFRDMVSWIIDRAAHCASEVEQE